MTAHMHVCRVGAVSVVDANRYVIEIGANDEDARNFVSFSILPGEVAVLPERLMIKNPCASKKNDTVRLIQDICSKQLSHPGGVSFRRLYRVIDVDRSREIGHAKLTKMEITLEPLFDLDEQYEPIPCKR